VKVIRVKLTPLQVAIRDLAEARVEAGLSVAEVAAKAGLSVATVTRLEKGRAKHPTVDVLERYARAVGRELRLSVEPAK
jgi:transcriptional regulator with XRE-family HTH domain